MANVELTADRRARREAALREHMDSENVQAWGRTMATFSHPRYELIGSGEVYDGADEVLAYWLDGRTTFPDQRNEAIAIHHADDAMIAEFWLRGTHLGGANPTGRRFKCQMCAIFTFDADDAMTCERVYFDRSTILRQLKGDEIVGADD